MIDAEVLVAVSVTCYGSFSLICPSGHAKSGPSIYKYRELSTMLIGWLTATVVIDEKLVCQSDT